MCIEETNTTITKSYPLRNLVNPTVGGSTMGIAIRQEEIEDVTEVYRVIQKAFENADYSDHDEHHLVNRLRNSTKFIPELSLVA